MNDIQLSFARFIYLILSFILVKRRHEYHIYKFVGCGAAVWIQIDKKLKEQNQYGSKIQAVALSLMATGNVAINKVRMLINGMSDGLMSPSEGFNCKLYKRAAQGLSAFVTDLRKLLITRTLVYWDDTVIMIQTARACMRFYGDETISYYTAHERKDLDGLLEDDILTVLTSDTTVMHDHNKVNYKKHRLRIVTDFFIDLDFQIKKHLLLGIEKSPPAIK